MKGGFRRDGTDGIDRIDHCGRKDHVFSGIQTQAAEKK
jgi:hypothetical protein